MASTATKQGEKIEVETTESAARDGFISMGCPKLLNPTRL